MLPDSLPLFASRRARSGLLDTYPWQAWKLRKNPFKSANGQAYFAVDNPSWTPLTYEEVSSYSIYNSYITDLYRPALSSTQCLVSIFRLHNETVNIWTHLIGFLVFSVLLPYDLLISLPEIGPGYSFYLTHAAFSSTVGLFFFLSAAYHIFSCHPNESIVRRWSGFDQFGLWTAIIGCYIPGLRLGLWCIPEVNWLYSCTIILTGISGMILLLAPASRNYSCLKYIMTMLLASTGLIPLLHWIAKQGLHSSEVETFLPQILKFYTYIILGALVYLARLPERFSPGGILNLVGSSHNIWHIVLVVTLVNWRHALLEMLRFRVEVPCP